MIFTRTPVPTGMLDLVVENQTASVKTFDLLPLSVKDYFSVMKKTFNPKDYEVKVQSEGKYIQYHVFAKLFSVLSQE